MYPQHLKQKAENMDINDVWTNEMHGFSGTEVALYQGNEVG